MPFSDIIGHDWIISVLRRSLKSGKTAHAYIFDGPSGCGRKKTAFSLIQGLFCTAADSDSCGTCVSCRKVAAYNHPDIHMVEPAPGKRDITIQQLRDAQRLLAMRPYEAQLSACIIDPSDRMNTNSANSFLKTLEEPPGNAIIILITENADSLLPTIRSRCRIIRFAPLAQEHVRVLLERNGMSPENAALLAPLSNGSVSRAIELDNGALTLRREKLLKRLSALSIDRVATVFDASEDLSNGRDETLESLDMLLSFARDMIHLAVGNGDRIDTAIRPELELLSARLKLKGTIQLAEDAMETYRTVKRNANAKLALDNLFIKTAGNLTG